MAELPPKKKKLQHGFDVVPDQLREPTAEYKQRNKKQSEIADIQDEVSKFLKLSTFEPERKYWLDTGSADLNKALGAESKGLCYGKITELAGPEHGGKTTLTTILAGLAQQDGAAVWYLDLENSRDPLWAGKLGLDFKHVYPIYPKLEMATVKAKKEDDGERPKGKKMARLQGAEDLFLEAETVMELFRQRGYKKQFGIIDSIAMLYTNMVVEAGTGGQNMRTRMDRAMFLSETLPRWAGLAFNYNAMIFLINQERIKPGVAFGDPRYAPGGKSRRHACSTMAWVRRLKNGKLRKNGEVVGIRGIVENYKNKVGDGSVQDALCGFKVLWNRNPAKVTFIPASEAKKLLKGEI